jgi:MYXO-CTERM domain-containing protein
VALERLIFLKVAMVLTLVVLALWLAVGADTWRALPHAATSIGTVPSQLGFALLLGAVAFAGIRRRAESLPEQLDSRQGVRHGAVRAASS